MPLLFAGNTLKYERLKISSEIKGNFKFDGNVLEITGGPRLVLFLGTGKNRSMQNSYELGLHSQFPLVRKYE